MFLEYFEEFYKLFTCIFWFTTIIIITFIQGYTPLHLATQFGRDNIFELLWNVYSEY